MSARSDRADSSAPAGSKHQKIGVLAWRLTKMVRPVLPMMLFSILMGILSSLVSIAFMVWSTVLLANAAGWTELPSSVLVTNLITLAVLKGVFYYLEQYSGHDVAFRLLALIREKIYAALRRLAPAKLVDKRSGDLVTTIMADVEYIEVFFAHTIAPIIIAVVVPFSVLVFLAEFWIGFAALQLFFYLTAVGIPVLFFSSARKVGRNYRQDLATMNTHLLDSLQGLREIIQFGRGTRRLHEIQSNSEKLNDSNKSLRRHESMMTGAVDALVTLSMLLMFFLAAWRTGQGLLSINYLLVVVVASVSSFTPLIALNKLSNPVMHTFAAAERIFALLDEKAAVVDKGADEISITGEEAKKPIGMVETRTETGAGKLPQEVKQVKSASPAEQITFDHVQFAYPNTEGTVLKDFVLTIKPGEKVALVGKSGCGKTTVLRLLMRFWDVEDGAVFAGGKDIRTLPLGNLRDLISLVEQETYLFDETIADNIRIGKPDASAAEVEASAKASAIHDFIMTLPQEYETPVGELGDNLSGGERQRIAIARALLYDAPVLLLDEATSSLDLLNEKSILRLMHTAFTDKTVITVSHRPSAVAGADKIYLLESGRIIESGTHQDLLAQKGVYWRGLNRCITCT